MSVRKWNHCYIADIRFGRGRCTISYRPPTKTELWTKLESIRFHFQIARTLLIQLWNGRGRGSERSIDCTQRKLANIKLYRSLHLIHFLSVFIVSQSWKFWRRFAKVIAAIMYSLRLLSVLRLSLYTSPIKWMANICHGNVPIKSCNMCLISCQSE